MNTAPIVIDVKDEYISRRIPIESRPRESSLDMNTTILQCAVLPPLALIGVEVASTVDWIRTLASGSRSDS